MRSAGAIVGRVLKGADAGLRGLRHGRTRTPRGHTLAELMVVLTILTLFALLVIPRFIGTMYRNKLDVALSAVRTDLDFARARATATGLRHQVMINAESGEIVVAPVRMSPLPQDAATGVQPGATEALRDTLSQDVRVVEWSITPMQGGTVGQTDVLTMYPEGRSDSAMLVLEDGGGNQRGLMLDGFTGDLRELTPEELPTR